jgi:hypothetical protein
MIGDALTLTIDPRGNITNISGGEGLMSIFSLAGGAGGASGTGGLKQLFGPMFSIKSNPGPVSVGQTWEHIDIVDTGPLGKLRLVTKHTLKSAAGKEAKIDFSGTVAPDSEGDPGAAPFRVTKASHSGRYAWDLRAGSLKQMDSSLNTTLEGEVAGGHVTSSSDSTLKITRID